MSEINMTGLAGERGESKIARPVLGEKTREALINLMLFGASSGLVALLYLMMSSKVS